MAIRRKSMMHCSRLLYAVLKISWNRYVAKIIFTYILGYKVDVGHMEAVNLISSPKYSEKQIVRALLGIFSLLWVYNLPSHTNN